MTNYERIQNMSVDEMAEFIEEIMSCVQGCARIPDCKLCTISDFCRRGYFINEWLVKEANEKRIITAKMIDPDIKRIADHYGAVRQLDKLMRELIELADAINHYTEHKCDERDVWDEIADVEIMLEQVVYLLSEDDNARVIIDSIKEKKILRQIGRIEWE